MEIREERWLDMSIHGSTFPETGNAGGAGLGGMVTSLVWDS